MKPRTRAAFTLLELLIAIGVVAILAGMVFVGFKYVGARARERATRQTLENLRALLTELDVATRLSGIPLQAVPAPGNVSPGEPDRTSLMVHYTRAIVQRLMAVPANRSAVEKLPADTLMPLTPGGGPVWSGSMDYVAPQSVRYQVSVADPEYVYICIQDTAFTGRVAPLTEQGKVWMRDGTDPAPVPLDAWNNPILFAPARGLYGVNVTGRAAADAWAQGVTYSPGSRVSRNIGGTDCYFVCVQGHTATAADPPPHAVYWAAETRSLDNRPFFVSAGPDGNFQTGDDNIYSFEN